MDGDLVAYARADSAALAARVDMLNRAGAWPWLQPGYGRFAEADPAGIATWTEAPD